jgi:hypothetical protein
VGWSRYFDAVDEYRTPGDGELLWLEALARSRNVSTISQRSALLGPHPVRLVTPDPVNETEVGLTFARALDLLDQARPFHWTFRDYYGWRKRGGRESLRGFPSSCEPALPGGAHAGFAPAYRSSHAGFTPSYLSSISSKYLARLCTHRSSLLLSTHLRWSDFFRDGTRMGRGPNQLPLVGDAAQRISHLLHRAVQLRNLSLAAHAPRLVIFSDWHDRTYLRNLTLSLPTAFSNVTGRPRLDVHLGDAQINETVTNSTDPHGISLRGDNYILYQIGKSVMNGADVHVQWRGCEITVFGGGAKLEDSSHQCEAEHSLS